MKKTSSLILASLLIVGGISTASPAFADPAGSITFCHATGSASNPYEEKTTNLNGLHGHAGDTGDIIPTNEGTVRPEGQNLTEEGIYLLAHGCVAPVSATPSPSSSAPAPPSETASPAPTETAEPSTPASVPPSPTSSPSTPMWTPEDCVLPEGVHYEQVMNSGMGKTGYKATAPEGFGFATDEGVKNVLEFEGAIPKDGGFCPALVVVPLHPVTDAPWNSGQPSPSTPPVKGSPSPSASPWIYCKDLGRVNIPITDPAYDSRNDHDNDGYACDDHQPTKGLPVPAQTEGSTQTSTSTSSTSSVQPLTAPVTTSAASPAQPEQLAYTGADKTGWAVVGGILVLLGLLFLVAPKLLPNGKH